MEGSGHQYKESIQNIVSKFLITSASNKYFFSSQLSLISMYILSLYLFLLNHLFTLLFLSSPHYTPSISNHTQTSISPIVCTKVKATPLTSTPSQSTNPKSLPSIFVYTHSLYTNPPNTHHLHNFKLLNRTTMNENTKNKTNRYK